MLEESIKNKVDKLFLNASKKEEKTRREIQRFEKIYLETQKNEIVERETRIRDTTLLGHRFRRKH